MRKHAWQVFKLYLSQKTKHSCDHTYIQVVRTCGVKSRLSTYEDNARVAYKEDNACATYKEDSAHATYKEGSAHATYKEDSAHTKKVTTQKSGPKSINVHDHTKSKQRKKLQVSKTIT